MEFSTKSLSIDLKSTPKNARNAVSVRKSASSMFLCGKIPTAWTASAAETARPLVRMGRYIEIQVFSFR